MAELTHDLQSRYGRLRDILRELGSVAVAFSGGADSALVLKVALDVLGAQRVVAVTGRSDSLAARELRDAEDLARRLQVRHVLLDTDEFSDPQYLSNPANRCYFCKTALYRHMAEFIRSEGLAAIVNGINADDLGDFRPGIQAATEHDVHAPVAEAGLGKQDVRVLSAHLGLPTADKPASPCLSSRIPYGEAVTADKLRRIELAEAFVREEAGVGECRVRHHGLLARVEVPVAAIPRMVAEPLRSRLEARLRELGFQYVTLDLSGLRSGSLNEVLQLGLPASRGPGGRPGRRDIPTGRAMIR